MKYAAQRSDNNSRPSGRKAAAETGLASNSTARELPREEALAEAEDCLAEAVAGYLVRRECVPEPAYTDGDAFVALDPLLAAKAALHNAMLDAVLSRTELAARLGVDEKIVHRLLDPKHQSHIRAVLRAAALLGLKAEVRFERAA